MFRKYGACVLDMQRNSITLPNLCLKNLGRAVCTAQSETRIDSIPESNLGNYSVKMRLPQSPYVKLAPCISPPGKSKHAREADCAKLVVRLDGVSTGTCFEGVFSPKSKAYVHE